ncbi:MAG: hypothetical protein KF795_09455 [Labilithrix sp.]|nr:hypothetical protein [Labilithrix sp.]
MPRPPRPYAIGAAVVTALLGAVGFLPLFGGPGYEHALASGLIVPSAAAIATAIDAARRGSPSPLASVARGVIAGLAYAALALATALLHALRIGVCELWGALVYFGLTAGAGALLGGAWGAVAGELTGALAARGRVRRRRFVATALALAAPVAGVAVSVHRFHTSPMIFAFDPFVGYFSGTLYDTVIDAGTSLLTYRLGSLATLTAALLAASILERADERPFGLVLDLRSDATRARGALALLAGAASAAIALAGSTLGHYSTTESIVKDLGAEKHGARCDVVYPSTTREEEAKLLLKDCEEQLAAVEQRLGARGPARIRAFFFRDDVDKKRLMGAAHTYIAKPWREEVYLQLGGYPHPVLGHELAHVVAGSFGRGAFRIAGDLGGYLANPGLIEGIAVFASPDDEDLTDEQWARAMMQIGILPSMERVFSLGFLGDASAKSYTLAGAFISWMADRWGTNVVRAWYGGGDVAQLTGMAWPALDAAFREHLGTVPLPPEAESFARAKFSRPGIFGRKCPHLVDATRREADVCRDTQRYDEAIRLYDEALAKDALDHASRHWRAHTMRRHGEREEGRRDLEKLASREDVPRTWRDRAEEALADADFIDGELASARRRYEALAARSLDEDNARTFEVKALATADPPAREAIQALLLGDERRGPDIFLAGTALGRWPAATRDGRSPLASYLVGRNLVQRGFFDKGAEALEDALAGPLPTPRIARETLRQRAVAACASGDRDALARLKRVIEGPDDPFKGASGGRREATLRMIARCAR